MGVLGHRDRQRQRMVTGTREVPERVVGIEGDRPDRHLVDGRRPSADGRHPAGSRRSAAVAGPLRRAAGRGREVPELDRRVVRRGRPRRHVDDVGRATASRREHDADRRARRRGRRQVDVGPRQERQPRHRRDRRRQVGHPVEAGVEREQAVEPLGPRGDRRGQHVRAVQREHVAPGALVAPQLLVAHERQRGGRVALLPE